MTEPGYKPKYFAPAGGIHRHSPPKEDGSEAHLAPVYAREPAYVYTDEIVLAVNVAIATGRPLLVRGESGSGKSSLARNVANWQGWPCYQTVVTSRTQARDLQWEVDLVRRLHDAQAEGSDLPASYRPYITPGVLWWAFDRDGAAKLVQRDVKDLGKKRRAVVLIDEIDKADPDVPNNLLEPLGSLRFTVDETGDPVVADEDQAPLVFMATNGERGLPPAFLRRCVEIKLELPRRGRMLRIAAAHLGVREDTDPGAAGDPVAEEIVADLAKIADALLGPIAPDDPDPISPLSPADFLDTVRAQRDLHVDLDSRAWQELTAITAWKHGRRSSTT